MKKNGNTFLILETFLSSNGKLYTYIFFLVFLAITFAFIVESPFIWTKVLGSLIFLIILFIGVSLLFIKKGFVIKYNEVHLAHFAWGKLMTAAKIKVADFPKVSVLKFKRKERIGFSIANPNFHSEFNSFEIFILNDKHTQKKKLMALKKEENSESAIHFLTENSNLTFEIYSPDFS